MRFHTAFPLLLISLALTGCASVSVQHVAHDDVVTKGIRYNRPAPYLAVTYNSAATGLQASIVWLPDLSQEYAINMRSGMFGTTTMSPTFDNGWNLTGINATVDSGGTALVSALASVIPNLTLTADKTTIRPGIYRFLFQNDSSKPNFGGVTGIDWNNPVFWIGSAK